MGGPYSQDLRDRVLSAYDRGMATRQIAEVFEVSPSWARRIKQRRRESGQTTARSMGGLRVAKINSAHLAELVARYPDATLKELREKLGIVCAESAICMALKRLKISFKKRRSTPPSRIVRMWRRDDSSGKPVNPP
jgi:transposase